MIKHTVHVIFHMLSLKRIKICLNAAVKTYEFSSPPPLAFYICGWSPNAYIKHNKANSDAHLGHCKVGQHGGLILNQNFILSL